MATPKTQISKALEEALAKLRHDPSHPVRAHLDELDVELRVVTARGEEPAPGLGDRIAATLVTNDGALLDGTIPGLTVENWKV